MNMNVAFQPGQSTAASYFPMQDAASAGGAPRCTDIDTSQLPLLPACLCALALIATVLGIALPSPFAPNDSDTDDLAVERSLKLTASARDPGIFDNNAPTDAEIPSQAAHAINAAIPFESLGPDRATPLRISAQKPGYTRALDCLASAVLYEAGDDRIGQAAVAQVVLNRLRHPAFPHSVCAVVFQGAERATGCQFTFTCDGALQRLPTPAAWQRARETAAAFLAGETAPSVGMATHYHTDWVHPRWSISLDKIAKVGTHLFFRWRGDWGRHSAFTRAYSDEEHAVQKLAPLSLAHREARPAATVGTTTVEHVMAMDQPLIRAAREGDHFILVDADDDGSELAMRGFDQCLGQTYCKVVAWDRRSQDYGSPQNRVIRTVAFLYVRDKRTGVEIVLWDCARFNRPNDAQCLSDSNRRWITFQGAFSRAS